MNEHAYQSKMKSPGVAYALWFFLMAHFAYLGKWGLQILFWLTLGGLGIWWVVEAFMIPGRIEKYNLLISQKIESIEEKEDTKTGNLTIPPATQAVEENQGESTFSNPA
ncbi:MAG: TM2 domain-containing protein [Cytophagales bacterium]|nr:TM2 domain-containing protein [Cytophagales bacterium]